jgi:kynurenine 3-monooxygenase
MFIFLNGIYAATIRNSNTVQWTAVIGISEDDNDKELLLSENATNENISALKAYIKRVAPELLDIFPESNDEPYRKYFGKRSFNGSIVEVNALNYEEFCCLLGDAAHSLIPPTGEGINSGLEDAMILYELMKSNLSTTRITNENNNSSSSNSDLFETYHKIRHPNILAIVSLAKYLNENFKLKGVDAAARLGFTIIESILFGKDNYSNDTFGPNSIKRIAYSESITKFHNRYIE